MRRLSMKQKMLGVVTAFFFLTAPLSGEAKMLETAGLSNWSALIPHPLEENKFLAAAQDSIYVTASGLNEHWQKWSALPSKDMEIQKLFHFDQVPESVFVLADKGIYKTTLSASGYTAVYEKRSLNEQVTDFAVDPKDPKRWFVGTSTGILESKNMGESWHLFSPAGKSPVCFLRFSANRFFVARPDHLLVSENLSRFQKVFSLTPSRESEAENTSEASLSEDAEDVFSLSSCSLRDFTGSESGGSLWLATQKGVFQSWDAGLSWANTSSGGLLLHDIYFLAQDSKTKRIFAAGLNRVYEFSSAASRWREIPVHSDGSPIRGISVAGGNLKIATASGLMTYPLLSDGLRAPDVSFPGFSGKALLQDFFRAEPTVIQIHRAVSRYHHTQNSKINRWQAESRLRALFPTVSFKKDFSSGNNIDVDRGGTNDPDKFIAGPADTSRGWDFGVSWDLGDFIFSTSQTSIDSREKLMMELRHDLLSEATRLFYERRRLQIETVLNPASSEEEHLQRLLQIDELTALLDSLTNGFMIRQAELMYKEHPEFKNLWEYTETAGASPKQKPEIKKPGVSLSEAGPTVRTQH